MVRNVLRSRGPLIAAALIASLVLGVVTGAMFGDNEAIAPTAQPTISVDVSPSAAPLSDTTNVAAKSSPASGPIAISDASPVPAKSNGDYIIRFDGSVIEVLATPDS